MYNVAHTLRFSLYKYFFMLHNTNKAILYYANYKDLKSSNKTRFQQRGKLLVKFTFSTFPYTIQRVEYITVSEKAVGAIDNVFRFSPPFTAARVKRFLVKKVKVGQSHARAQVRTVSRLTQ